MRVVVQHDGDGAALLRQAGIDHGRKQKSFFLAVVALVAKFPQKGHKLRSIVSGNLLADRQGVAHAVQQLERGQDGVVFMHEVVDSQAHGVLLVEIER